MKKFILFFLSFFLSFFFLGGGVRGQGVAAPINIYLHRECCKTSFIVVLLWLPKIYFDWWLFYFSVHGDWQRNNIYLHCWVLSFNNTLDGLFRSLCEKKEKKNIIHHLKQKNGNLTENNDTNFIIFLSWP